MKYWLIYDKDNKIIGYSTYRQFEGQICVDEIPTEIKENEQKEKKIEENLDFLKKSNEKLFEYLCEKTSNQSTTLSEIEFKNLIAECRLKREEIKDLGNIGEYIK